MLVNDKCDLQKQQTAEYILEWQPRKHGSYLVLVTVPLGDGYHPMLTEVTLLILESYRLTWLWLRICLPLYSSGRQPRLAFPEC